jgi:hypothetical protein
VGRGGDSLDSEDGVDVGADGGGDIEEVADGDDEQDGTESDVRL